MPRRRRWKDPKGRRVGDADLVVAHDIHGREHLVPRAALPDPPPAGAVVYDLTKPGGIEALAIATRRGAQLADGAMTVRSSDLARASDERSSESVAALAEGAAFVLEDFRQRDQRRRSKGGRAEKKLPNIWMATCLLVAAEPGIKALDAWGRFPDGGDLTPTRREDWLVYRDGDDRLVDDAAGDDRSIGYPAFRAYVAAARRRLRTK
jgi:hypothetical protein